MDSLLKFSLIFLVIHVSHFATATGEYKSYENYKIFEIENSDGLDSFIDSMRQLEELDYYVGNKTTTQMLVNPNLLLMFKALAADKQLKTKLVVDDYSKVIETEKLAATRKKGFSWTAYYDVDDIYEFLKNMSHLYSAETQLVVGGKSYEGRQILGLRINTPEGSPDKPVVFIESGIHAREWITPATTTYFINQLLTNPDPKIMAMRDLFDWHIFPTVNPDGYHYSYKFDRMWRKTRSRSPNGCYGADPNRNWDYNWLQHGATSNPCDKQTYAGTHPFSEVETRTLSQYIRNLENLTGYISFHADAQMLLVPYSDSVEHTDNYDDLVQIGKVSLKYGYEVNEKKYGGPATAAEILYKASGGSMDWVRSALGTPIVYTYELRGTYFYWPPSRIYEQGDEVTQMMLGLVQGAKDLGYI